MMGRSRPFRIPIEDWKEIREIKMSQEVSEPVAFKRWKNKKMGIKWENY